MFQSTLSARKLLVELAVDHQEEAQDQARPVQPDLDHRDRPDRVSHLHLHLGYYTLVICTYTLRVFAVHLHLYKL